MKRLNILLVSAILICISPIVFSQNVVITDDDSYSPSSTNALLEVKAGSNNKGILIPRLTTVQRIAISLNATNDIGLLVYDTDSSSFFFYNGSSWIAIDYIKASIADEDNDTRIQVEKNADEDIIRFDVGGNEKWVIKKSRLEPSNTGNSVFIGEDAGLNDDLSDNNNIFLGYNSGYSNTTGVSNFFSGYQSGYSNATGNSNTFLGYKSAYSNTSGSSNIALGANSMYKHSSGNANIAIGPDALYFPSGSFNIAIGARAGYGSYTSTGGSNNLLLGYTAGDNLTTGMHNIVIGEVDLPNPAGAYQMVLGDPYAIYGNLSNNYIGIGTTNPSEKLTVGGNIYATSNVIVGGALKSSNTSLPLSTNSGTVRLVITDDNSYVTNTLKVHEKIIADNSNGLSIGPDAGYPYLYVADNGYIGIGTSSPSFPLHVTAYNVQYANYGWLNSGGGTGSASGYNAYSIRANERIMASEFNAVSDRRIKTNIYSSHTISDLDKINQLNLVNYNYIDSISKGNELQKGFIAQEVEKILPDAVNHSTDFIPDIFVLASQIREQDSIFLITIPKKHDLKAGDLVKLISPTGQTETEVLEAKSDTSFAVRLETSSNSIFVYGKQVNDFRAIDYDYIFSTGIGAIQELSKQNKVLQDEVSALKKQNEENASLVERIEKLEYLLGQVAKNN